MGKKTNTVANGLLLRADIHTLFDLGLISIAPDDRKIKVSKSLAGSIYARLNGKKLKDPKMSNARPSKAALEAHFDLFQP
jgi:predicted restriction endonuclease